MSADLPASLHAALCGLGHHCSKAAEDHGALFLPLAAALAEAATYERAVELIHERACPGHDARARAALEHVEHLAYISSSPEMHRWWAAAGHDPVEAP